MIFILVGSIIKCLIEKAGKIGSATKVSIPSVPTDLPPFSERDLNDLKFAVQQKVNIIILTSVKNSEALKFVKNTLGEQPNETNALCVITNSGLFNF